MKPIILVTAGKQNPATPRGEVQVVTAGCDVDYIQSVVRAGGAPVILPCVADPEAVRAVVQAVDGVLLTGGGDIVSLAYGEEPHPTSKLQDPARDAMEFEVTRRALERELPVLGVCRGVQVLNVAQGGTLIQDVPSQVPGAVKHYSEGLDTVLLHTVEIEADTLLARVLGTTSMAVNSWHHQAVREAGQGLRVNSRARDGVIEGLEAADGRPILGVQFHPEECTATYPQFQALFDWLVREAAGRARRG
jgi:gamma-glutamyl-gamma-aminobutyrate hydrolase PuuD